MRLIAKNLYNEHVSLHNLLFLFFYFSKLLEYLQNLHSSILFAVFSPLFLSMQIVEILWYFNVKSIFIFVINTYPMLNLIPDNIFGHGLRNKQQSQIKLFCHMPLQKHLDVIQDFLPWNTLFLCVFSCLQYCGKIIWLMPIYKLFVTIN